MSALESISAVTAINEATAALPSEVNTSLLSREISTPFSDFIAKGLQHVEDKVDIANVKVHEFSLDETVPIHEVTIALEEARLAVELALQVRSRLVEGYREIMNMQL